MRITARLKPCPLRKPPGGGLKPRSRKKLNRPQSRCRAEAVRHLTELFGEELVEADEEDVAFGSGCVIRYFGGFFFVVVIDADTDPVIADWALKLQYLG